MIVRLKTTLCLGDVWVHSGNEIELEDNLARRYIRAGLAESVIPQIETAALRTTAPKGKQDVRIQTAGR